MLLQLPSKCSPCGTYPQVSFQLKSEELSTSNGSPSPPEGLGLAQWVDRLTQNLSVAFPPMSPPNGAPPFGRRLKVSVDRYLRMVYQLGSESPERVDPLFSALPFLLDAPRQHVDDFRLRFNLALEPQRILKPALEVSDLRREICTWRLRSRVGPPPIGTVARHESTDVCLAALILEAR